MSEKIIYLRHIDLVIDLLKKDKANISKNALNLIQQHHENWDGSGFKGLQGTAIQRSARILRIADDVVGCVNHAERPAGFKEALQFLGSKRGADGQAIYDMDIISVLEKMG